MHEQESAQTPRKNQIDGTGVVPFTMMKMDRAHATFISGVGMKEDEAKSK